MLAFGVSFASWMSNCEGGHRSWQDTMLRVRPWLVWMRSLRKGGLLWQQDGCEDALARGPRGGGVSRGEVELSCTKCKLVPLSAPIQSQALA
mmetsp:Transcript_39555/g.73744  ORF Transcript_39555/g.73744 Transcript_39555/m.73744 type:complete len:92 (-) Transcript_39555:94-369(-)